MADRPREQDVINGRLARILLDLHRCEHGRLEGDPCLSCGGPSVGNRIMPPGSTIGHNRYGDSITVPSIEGHNDPKNWLTAT